jgi:uncharacterized protein
MSKDKHNPKPGKFCWNELVTTNVAGAKKFYGGLLGWKSKPFGNAQGYTIIMKGRDMVGGLMKGPKPGCPAQWVPYVIVDDVEATAKKAKKLRGKVVMAPFDVPTVGRIAVLVDPQGAVVGILKPLSMK